MGDVVEERRHTDGQGAEGDMLVQSPDAAVEANQFVLVEELRHLPCHGYRLTDDCSQRRAAGIHRRDSRKAKDQDGVQNDIGHHCR